MTTKYANVWQSLWLLSLQEISTTKKIRRQVGLLTEIQTCQRSSSEAAVDFSNRLNGAVAKCMLQTGSIQHTESQQFALMMIRKAWLPVDTLNAITLLLIAQEITDAEPAHISISCSQDEGEKYIASISLSMRQVSPGEKSNVLHHIAQRSSRAKRKGKAATVVNEDTPVFFILENASSSDSQVDLQNNEVKASELFSRPL